MPKVRKLEIWELKGSIGSLSIPGLDQLVSVNVSNLAVYFILLNTNGNVLVNVTCAWGYRAQGKWGPLEVKVYPKKHQHFKKSAIVSISVADSVIATIHCVSK